MGTIITRPRKDGTNAFLAQISIVRDGRFVHRESKTFDRRPAAAAWIKRREDELAEPGGLEAAARETGATIADAIDRYIETRQAIGKTMHQVLLSTKDSSIGRILCHKVTPQDIVDWCVELSKGREASTVNNYLAHLSSVFSVAEAAFGIPLDPAVMRKAKAAAKTLKLTGKARRRTRRPGREEMDRLMQHFDGIRIRRPGSVDMVRVAAFALVSGRRQEEIVTLRWADVSRADPPRILVRDMKHPGDKAGNDTWCRLTPEALAIIDAMPQREDRIFPYSTDAVGAAFTRACQRLGIDDLHFHDLRHEAISRLLEMGWTIPQAADVSGHRSWDTLKRYTHLSASGDRWADWSWLSVAMKKEPR